MMLQRYVPSVSFVFSDICCKYFYLDVAYVLYIHCKYFIWIRCRISFLAFCCLTSVSPPPPGADWASASPPPLLDAGDVGGGAGPTWACKAALETD
jgi:hypothetical protein